jgi:hypothetical protein
MAKIVSKGQFAKLVGVTAGRVTQWISAKQIYGDALVGEGRAARIRVASAIAQLRSTVDGSTANARLRLDGLSVDPNGDSQAAGTSDATVENSIKVARLGQLELSNARARAEAAAASGRYTKTADVKQQMGRISSTLINAFEGHQAELASKIAAKFSLSLRDVQHFTRAEFRTFRVRASDALRQQAQEIPEFVEDDLAADPAGDEAAAVVEPEKESGDVD